MKKIFWVFVLVAASVLLVGCGWASKNNKNLDSFAACLTEKWVKMYWTDWCHVCAKTKQDFGTAFDKITYINCDPSNTQRPENLNIQCVTANVQGYPTWSYNWSQLAWYRTVDELSKLTWCSLDAQPEQVQQEQPIQTQPIESAQPAESTEETL